MPADPFLNAIYRDHRAADTREPEHRLELGLSGDFVSEFSQFIAWVRDQAQQGTGVTITAVTNGGDKREAYVDGDGADRINGISLDGSADVDCSYE